MKNQFIAAAIFSAFLLGSPNAKAANFTDNRTVDANKTWSIQFNDQVRLDDLTKQSIIVTDSKSNKIAVGLQLGQDNRTVIVTAPQGSYTVGENYILDIGTKIHSSKGRSLNNEYKVHFNVRSSDNNSIVTFKDKGLEQVVRDTIKKPTGDIYKNDVEKITKLNAIDRKIQDISTLKELTNLQTLSLSANQISDISALKGLANLQTLELTNNRISDISALKGLTNLQTLDLAANQISDISALKELTNLQTLELTNNQISDVSTLKGLTNLQTLVLFGNQISDISALKGLSNLQKLSLSSNKVSDISALKGLTNLQKLYLYANKISDISALKELTNLQTLVLTDNRISDYDKQSLKNTLAKCSITY